MQDPKPWQRAVRFRLKVHMQGQHLLGRTVLQVLGMLMAQEHGRQTNLREMADRIGCAVNNVKWAFDRLLAAGLVTCERGKARTMRVTCRFIPASQLGQEPRKEG